MTLRTCDLHDPRTRSRSCLARKGSARQLPRGEEDHPGPMPRAPGRRTMAGHVSGSDGRTTAHRKRFLCRDLQHMPRPASTHDFPAPVARALHTRGRSRGSRRCRQVRQVVPILILALRYPSGRCFSPVSRRRAQGAIHRRTPRACGEGRDGDRCGTNHRPAHS